MIKRILILGVGLLCLVVKASAESSLVDEFLQLNRAANTSQESVSESPKKIDEIVQKKPIKRYIRLSNGKQVDISEWQIVHFMSSTCTYCRQFNPILKRISDDTKIPVFTYSLDGIGDEYFPNAFPATKEVMNEFFPELPQATPTDFLINVNTLITLPISQGSVNYQEFLQRLDEVFLYVDKNLEGVK